MDRPVPQVHLLPTRPRADVVDRVERAAGRIQRGSEPSVPPTAPDRSTRSHSEADAADVALRRRLDGESEHTLGLTMHFPTAWDPYFRPRMSVRDVYHYGTERYEHHRRQLTLE